MTTATLSRPTPTLDAIQMPLLLTHDDELWALLEEVPDVLLAGNANAECRINQLTPQHGHLVIKWKQNDAQDVEKARKTFETLLQQGYSIFVAVRGDKPGEPAAKFDAKAKKYVVEPPAAETEKRGEIVQIHAERAEVHAEHVDVHGGQVAIREAGEKAKLDEKAGGSVEPSDYTRGAYGSEDDGKKHARTTKFSAQAQEYTATRPLRGG